jgi:hypothetical protein
MPLKRPGQRSGSGKTSSAKGLWLTSSLRELAELVMAEVPLGTSAVPPVWPLINRSPQPTW